MSAIGDLIRQLGALGATPEMIAAAVEAMEANRPPDRPARTPRQARNRRYYERKCLNSDAAKTLSDGQDISDAPSRPPCPPSLPPTPPTLPPIIPPHTRAASEPREIAEAKFAEFVAAWPGDVLPGAAKAWQEVLDAGGKPEDVLRGLARSLAQWGSGKTPPRYRGKPENWLRKALGYSEVWTYTLPEEPGTSLRAAGFVDAGLTKGGEWSTPARLRAAAARPEAKRRWCRNLGGLA